MEIVVGSNIETPTLDRVELNLSRLPQIREGIGVYMVASVIQNFEAQGRPNAWADLQPGTWKRKKGSMILHEGGFLKAGIMSWVGGDTVYIGPSGPGSVYAATHHFGDEDRNIPERPFLVFQEEDTDYISSLIREEIFR